MDMPHHSLSSIARTESEVLFLHINFLLTGGFHIPESDKKNTETMAVYILSTLATDTECFSD